MSQKGSSVSSKRSKHPENESTFWFIYTLGLIGLATSVYLVKDHFEAQKSICDLGNHFSCSVVNRSSYSELFNVPVAVFGASWFIALMAFTWKIHQNTIDRFLWVTLHLLW